MAKKKPPQGPDKPGKDDDKKNKDLPEWLRTDDWLQITPPPTAKGLPETPSGRIPVGLPPSKSDDQNTDMIQLDDDDNVLDVAVPPSTMLFSDPDDSVILTDDLLSGPASSSNLKPSSSSSLRLPKIKAEMPPKSPTAAGPDNAEDDIDLGSMPGVENPAAAGPQTSSIRKRQGTPAGSEDVIGQPLTPTDPASGWLGSGTKLAEPPPTPTPNKPYLPSVPSMGNIASTWAELDLPQGKAAPEPPKAPAEPPKAEKHDSWHPSSGNIGVPSMANIDLPPELGQTVSGDIFSKATRPGLAPGAFKSDPVKIARPKAPEAEAPKPPEPKAPAELATPSLQLPSLPNVPAEPQKGSWHPSSGNVNLPSAGNIDLPPVDSSNVFTEAKKPGRAPDPTPAKPVLPPLKTPAKKPAPEPQWLQATNISIVPGGLTPTQAEGSWLSGAAPTPPAAKSPPTTPPTKADIRPEPSLQPSSADFELPPADASESPSTPPAPAAKAESRPAPDSGLQPTSSFKGGGSSADFELPPRAADDPEPSDIFSTARKANQPVPKGDSGLFTGAEAPDSSFFRDLPKHTDGESNLFADPDEPRQDTGRVSMAPPGMEVTGDINLSRLLPGSKTDAVSFSMPPAGVDESVGSSIEVLDTSGMIEPGDLPAPKSSTRLGVDPIIEDASTPDPEFTDGADELEAELAQQVQDADDRPDFNILHGQSSDSNLLGDRTLVDAGLIGPQSSSVNLADPNALSRDPTADSGQASSIFNKPDSDAQRTGGQIDMDSIPLMGSSDDGTMAVDTSNSAVLGGRLDDPQVNDLEASVFDVTMPKDETADSGMIDWSTDAAKVTNRLGDASNRQPTMERTMRSEISEDEDDSTAESPKHVRKAEPKRPISRPEINLDEADTPKGGKGRNGLLIGALSLLAGAGIGAGAMFLASGPADDKKGGDPAMAAQLVEAKGRVSAAEVTAEQNQRKAEAADAANKTLAATNAELKKTVETSATAVADAKKATDDRVKAETDLANLKKASGEEVAAAKKKADDLEAASKVLETDKAKLLEQIKKSVAENTDLTMAANVAKKDVEEKAKQLTAAKAAAETAAAKLKAADATLDPIIEKLKAAKLIDEKADRAKALAALPDAIKKANLITGDGDAGKLAKELTDTRAQLKSQKDDADKAIKTAEDKLAVAKKDADKQLADAKATAEKSMADLQKKADAADARIKEEVKAAVAVAKKDADAEMKRTLDAADAFKQDAIKAMAQAKVDRANEAKQFDAKLTALRDEFEGKIAAIKSGAVVPLENLFAANGEKAAVAYDAGTSAYFAGRYADAEKAFADAAKADQTDARYWYFLGLSKYAQGKAKDAEADFKKGADWEGRGKPGRRAVATALEQVQGAARAALEAARP